MSAFRWLELGEIDKGIKAKPKIDEKKRKVLEDLKRMQQDNEENKEEENDENEDEYEEEEEEEENDEKTTKDDDKFEETKEYLEYKEEEENKAFEQKYKLYLSVYTDANVSLQEDKKEDLDEGDNDLSNYNHLCLI